LKEKQFQSAGRMAEARRLEMILFLVDEFCKVSNINGRTWFLAVMVFYFYPIEPPALHLITFLHVYVFFVMWGKYAAQCFRAWRSYKKHQPLPDPLQWQSVYDLILWW
jgi:hypothetical protein